MRLVVWGFFADEVERVGGSARGPCIGDLDVCSDLLEELEEGGVGSHRFGERGSVGEAEVAFGGDDRVRRDVACEGDVGEQASAVIDQDGESDLELLKAGEGLLDFFLAVDFGDGKEADLVFEHREVGGGVGGL